jgi:hypothetical protein
MGLVYIDPVVHYDFSVFGKDVTIANLRTVLEAAGFTVASEIAAFVTGTFTGQPTNGQTITIDGVVLTARTTATLGTEFQIGSTTAETASNMATCINNNVSSVTAAANGSDVTITADTWPGNGITTTEGLSNFTFSGTSLSNGGVKIDAPATAQFVQGFRLHIFDRAEASGIAVNMTSLDESIDFGTSAGVWGGIRTDVSGRRMRAIASPAGLFTYLPNDMTGGGGNSQWSLLGVPDIVAPLEIGNVASSGGLIEITTNTPLGTLIQTGNQVYISGVLGVPADGSWTVTTTGSNSFTLDGSTFSGTYTSGGAAAGPQQTAQVFFFWSQVTNSSAGGQNLRRSILCDVNGEGTGTKVGVCRNGTSNAVSSSTGPGVGRPVIFEVESDAQHETGPFVEYVPWVRFTPNTIGTGGGSANGKLQGVLPNGLTINSAQVASDADGDEVFMTEDGEFWFRYTWNQAKGCLCFRVPGAAGSPPTATITVI